MTSALRGLPVGAVPNEQALNGSASSSRTSILQYGPDREELGGTSFPIYCNLEARAPAAEIYARSLLSLGHGFGLNNLIGDVLRPQEHIRLGALLGDVGWVHPDGSFDFCFNIFHPKDHPIQCSRPENFTPLQPPPSPDEAIEMINYFKPGTVMASEGVQVKRISDSPLEVEFISSVREAAVLVLPTGGAREEFVNPSKLHSYLREEAPNWYEAWNGNSDDVNPAPIANGTLWVVVGVDRVDSWAMATLPYKDPDVGKRTKFVYKQDSDSGFSWEDDGKYQPHYRENRFPDGKLGAIFLRVLSVALSPHQWAQKIATVPEDCIPYYRVVPTLSFGLRAWLRRVFSGGGGTRSSNGRPIFFHPSIILLHIMLLAHPEADVGIVADSVWQSQLSQRHLTHPEVVRLIRRVIETHDIVTTDGVSTYVPRTATSSSKSRALTTYINGVVPWLVNPSKEELDTTLQIMVKVLGIRRP